MSNNMDDDTFILDDGEPKGQIFDDNPVDMDVEVDGEDEEEVVPEDPEDDDFRLDGFGDLGMENDEDEYEDDGKAQGYDPEYDEGITGRKRKRVKFAPVKATHVQRSNMRGAADKEDPFILDDDTGFATKPSSRVPGTFGRRNRKKGETLPAYHKRVSHELDSDDELMMEMREKGFSDRQIADRLANDGRVRYDQKSISTRIMRIRNAQADNVDYLLREGYKEWEFEDDCLLMQAHALADIEVNYEVERIRAWRYRKVSEYMRRLKKNALFSANACRERYEAIVEGTAHIPTEMDDDPDTRRLELENYRQARAELREKEQTEKDAKEANERKTKDEARTRNAQKAEEIAHKRQQKEEEKAQRAVKRAAAAQVRLQRAKENSTAKVQRNTQLKKKASKGKGKGKAPVPTQSVSNPKGSLNIVPKDKVTADTPDPRSYLSVVDLTKMCADRGLPVLGKNKDQLISDLRDADEEWSQADLQKMCRAKGLATTSNKLQMKYQLAFAAAQVCKSFRANATGDDVAMDDEE